MLPSVQCLRKSSCQLGFTLLEVMIAMAIVAVGIAAAIGVVNSVALNTSRLEDKIISQWIASNRIVEVRLNQHNSQTSASSGAESAGSITMAGRDWYVFDKTIETDLVNVFQTTVKVCLKEDKSNCPLEKKGYFTKLRVTLN